MRKKRLIIIFTYVATIGVFAVLFPKLFYMAIIISLFVLCIYLLNHYALTNIEKQKQPFQPNSLIRNIDYLIIGDMIKADLVIPSDKSYVQIKAPDRSLNAAFEILKHTTSILDEENGNVVLAIKRENINKAYSIFDIPFFYYLTIKKYHIERLSKLSRVPLIVKPVSTLRILFNICNNEWVEKPCPNSDIIEFCDEHNIELKYYE